MHELIAESIPQARAVPAKGVGPANDPEATDKPLLCSMQKIKSPMITGGRTTDLIEKITLIFVGRT
jgi:hypothetical protein